MISIYTKRKRRQTNVGLFGLPVRHFYAINKFHKVLLSSNQVLSFQDVNGNLQVRSLLACHHLFLCLCPGIPTSISLSCAYVYMSLENTWASRPTDRACVTLCMSWLAVIGRFLGRIIFPHTFVFTLFSC